MGTATTLDTDPVVIVTLAVEPECMAADEEAGSATMTG